MPGNWIWAYSIAGGFIGLKLLASWALTRWYNGRHPIRRWWTEG